MQLYFLQHQLDVALKLLTDKVEVDDKLVKSVLNEFVVIVKDDIDVLLLLNY